MPSAYGGYNGYGTGANPFLEGFLGVDNMMRQNAAARHQQAMDAAQKESQRAQFEFEQMREQHNQENQKAHNEYLQKELQQRIDESNQRQRDMEASKAEIASQKAIDTGEKHGDVALASGAPYRSAVAMQPEGSPAIAGYSAGAQGAFANSPTATVPTGSGPAYSPSPDASMPPASAPAAGFDPSVGMALRGAVRGPAAGAPPTTNVSNGPNMTATDPASMAAMLQQAGVAPPTPSTPQIPAMQSPDMQALATPSTQGDYTLDQQSPGFLAAQAYKSAMSGAATTRAQSGATRAAAYQQSVNNNGGWLKDKAAHLKIAEGLAQGTLDERTAHDMAMEQAKSDALDELSDMNTWKKANGITSEMRTSLYGLKKDALTQKATQFAQTHQPFLKQWQNYASMETANQVALNDFSKIQAQYGSKGQSILTDIKDPTQKALELARFQKLQGAANDAQTRQSQLNSDPIWQGMKSANEADPSIITNAVDWMRNAAQATGQVPTVAGPNGAPKAPVAPPTANVTPPVTSKGLPGIPGFNPAVGIGGASKPAASSAVPTISGDADYAKLKSGTVFVGPDGRKHRKP